MIILISGAPNAYADGPGGNVADPVVRAVDIAKPAVVRIITQVVGQLTVNFPGGQSVTFPQTPQQGFNGYPLDFSGSGAFISAHGDILTADHVVNPVQDDRTALDQGLQQTASQDVADYINLHLKPAQPATPGQVTQELNSGQLPSTTQYQQPKSRIYLSVEFSGPLNAPDFQSIPASQYANVDQIKQHVSFDQGDIAIIHVNGLDNMPMLQLDDSSTVQAQDQLTIIGFPGNGDVSTAPTDFLRPSIINQIYVSAIKSFNGSPVIQVSGNVEQGDSGGPALDNHGKVVGIVSFGSVATQGSTSFLRASNSAKQLIQQAGINTASSAFQQSWSKAFNDYASTAAGHWHQSSQELQQIATQYPRFQAINPFLQYAKQQAQTEPQTQGTNPTSPGTSPVSSSSGLNPLYIVVGGGAALIILLLGGFAVSRRRKPAAVVAAGYPYTPGQSYGAPAATPGVSQPQPGQGISGVIPQTPMHSGQSAYQQQPNYGSRSSIQSQPAASMPQPGLPSQPAAPQQSYRPQPAPSSGMAAFGAPNVPSTPQPTSAAPDATLVARPNTPSSQWRTWPCGHTNRYDARFCGICGEPAPPAPIVRRVEQ